MRQENGNTVWMLTEKKEMLGQYYELTLAQEKLIEDEDTDGLLKNIRDRQSLLDRLNELEVRLRAARTDSSWLGGGKGQVADLQREVMELLKTIQEKDRQIQSAAVEKRDFFSSEIRRLRTKRKGVVEYSRSGISHFNTSSKFDKTM